MQRFRGGPVFKAHGLCVSMPISGDGDGGMPEPTSLGALGLVTEAPIMLSLRRKDLQGPVTRVKKKKKKHARVVGAQVALSLERGVGAALRVTRARHGDTLNAALLLNFYKELFINYIFPEIS